MEEKGVCVHPREEGAQPVMTSHEEFQAITALMIIINPNSHI
jgi:hypothetical protein